MKKSGLLGISGDEISKKSRYWSLALLFLLLCAVSSCQRTDVGSGNVAEKLHRDMFGPWCGTDSLFHEHIKGVYVDTAEKSLKTKTADLQGLTSSRLFCFIRQPSTYGWKRAGWLFLLLSG